MGGFQAKGAEGTYVLERKYIYTLQRRAEGGMAERGSMYGAFTGSG